jgi:L-ascorbate metabolism protein UlaG (beta-lactamase superfamily)
MVITNLGEGCFRLQSGEISLLLDPTGNRLKADVILRTATGGNEMDESPETISFPGEYEVKGIEIEGYASPGESTGKILKTVYSVLWEDIKFVFLGQLANPPETKVLERIGDPDILIIPVSGDHFFSPEGAAKLIKQVEPKVSIPSFAGDKDIKELRKAMGQEAEAEEKFVFKKKDLPLDHAKLVILKSKE